MSLLVLIYRKYFVIKVIYLIYLYVVIINKFYNLLMASVGIRVMSHLMQIFIQLQMGYVDLSCSIDLSI